MFEIKKTYNSFPSGISDDSFIGAENSIQDMDGIDVQSEERYAQCDTAYYVNEDRTLAWGATWIKETPYGNFISNNTKVQFWGADLVLWGTSWDWMESSWSGVSQETYFFERTWGVKKWNYDGSTIGAFLTTGYPTNNVAITAIGWHITNILFAKLNVIYSFDTTTNSTVTAVTLTPWTVVKYIYAYSINSVVVVAVNGNDTFIYELDFSWSSYNIVAKTPEVDATCIGAYGNKYDVFWIATNGIHQYQARLTQHIKYLTLASNAKVTYDKWLIILSWTNVYKLSKKKPWRNLILTKTEFTANLCDRSTILLNSWAGYKTYKKSVGYKRTNSVTLRPLDGWSYETLKHDLSYKFGFINPEWNTPTAETEKCWIKIEVQTDAMEKDISSFYVTVFEEYEDFIGHKEVNPTTVSKAIELAGYKSEFGYARTRITLYAGSEIWTTNIYEKTPKLFDFSIFANFLQWNN